MRKRILVSFITIILLCFDGCSSKDYNKPSEFPFIDSVNYNNYSSINFIDAYGDIVVCEKIALFDKPAMQIYNKGEKIKTIDEAISHYRVVENGVYYIAEKTLCFFNLQTNNVQRIKEDVRKYVIYGDLLIFETYKSELFIIENGKELKKVENVYESVVSKDNLYYVDEEKNFFVINLKKPFEKTGICQLPKEMSLSTINVCDDKVVLDNTTSFGIVDLKTKRISELPFPIEKESQYSFVCSDEAIYLTIARVKIEATFPKYIEDNNNGVWRININTGDMEKISTETFDKIYLFDETLVGQDYYKGFKIITA